MVRPETQFNALTVGGTVFIFYLVFKFVLPVIETWWTANVGPISTSIALYLLTFGTFRTLQWGLACILNNLLILKWLFLRKYYIEGTWVGYYYGENNEVRYAVDMFTQKVGSPVSVRGYAYTEDSKEYAEWTSVTSNFLYDGNKFVFLFDCDFKDRAKTEGITRMDLANIKRFSPNRIAGYSVNIGSDVRLEINEEKVSDDFLDPLDALAKAREVYQKVQAKLVKTRTPRIEAETK